MNNINNDEEINNLAEKKEIIETEEIKETEEITESESLTETESFTETEDFTETLSSLDEPVKTNDFNSKAIKKHFNIIEIKYFIGSILIIGIQLGVIALCQTKINFETADSNLVFAIQMLPFIIVGYPLFILLIKKTPKKITLPKMDLSFKQVFMAFLISYAILYLTNIVGTILTTIIGSIIGSPVMNVVQVIVSNTNVWMQLLIVVILAPVFEEIIFRKLLIDRTANYGEKVAMFLSAALFAIFHGNLGQGIYAFALGLFFAYVYMKTGQIKYTIILHMLVNFFGSVVAAQILKISNLQELLNVSGDTQEMITYLASNSTGIIIYMVYVLFLLAMVIAGIVVFATHVKKMHLDPHEQDIPKGYRFKTAFCNVGMLLCVLFFIGMAVYQMWPTN